MTHFVLDTVVMMITLQKTENKAYRLCPTFCLKNKV